MFGCICPGGSSQKKTCDRVFKAVNGNPCIGKLANDMFFPLQKEKKNRQEKRERKETVHNSTTTFIWSSLSLLKSLLCF